MRRGAPALYMSGHVDSLDPKLTEDTHFLQKPFSAGDLAEQVLRGLEIPVPVPQNARNAPARESARILVADDEPGVRNFLRHALERSGYRVQLAEDGEEALRESRNCLLDLVITDLVMPRREGIETIRKLRRETPHIGIIAMSGAFNAQFLSVAQMLGADAVLTKPVAPDRLLRTVSEVLEKRWSDNHSSRAP